jgi:hypothetical protein
MQQSAAVDNTVNQFIDVGVVLNIKTGAPGVSATGYVQVYACGTVDGGANYTGGASGANAAGHQTNIARLSMSGTGCGSVRYTAKHPIASGIGSATISVQYNPHPGKSGTPSLP